jgi:hypothetical protein
MNIINIFYLDGTCTLKLVGKLTSDKLGFFCSPTHGGKSLIILIPIKWERNRQQPITFGVCEDAMVLAFADLNAITL